MSLVKLYDIEGVSPKGHPLRHRGSPKKFSGGYIWERFSSETYTEVCQNPAQLCKKHLIFNKEEVVRVKKARDTTPSKSSQPIRPALTPEARENQMVSLAVDLAEKQLREGTASSQVVTHYLKLGSTKERIEKEILEKQKELIEAKTQSLQSAQRIEELYTSALNAMRNYSGQGDSDEY